MRNPFQFGGVVSGDAFCNRAKEIKDIRGYIENSAKVFIYAERRVGKTSLVKYVLDKLPRNRYLSAYVDLSPTDDSLSFATTTARAVTMSMTPSVERLLQMAGRLFSHLSPTLSIDREGNPALSFEIHRFQRPEPELEKVLAVPGRIAAQGKRKVVVVFDEFQQISEYSDNSLVERLLRSVIQTQENVAYVFMGSRKTLIQRMFLDKSRPLYKSAVHYYLKLIDKTHWLVFIRKKFTDTGKQISEEAIRSIFQMTQGHPYYTQNLCYHVWELCEENSEAGEDLIQAAMDNLLIHEGYVYTNLWTSLTINQRRFLKALASEVAEVKPFGSDFLERHCLGSPSSVQRAVKALVEKDIIDRDNGRLTITDRFMKIWIQRMREEQGLI